MTMQTRWASRFVSGLLLVTLVLAVSELVKAQPQDKAPGQSSDAGEATFMPLGEEKYVNLNNLPYASDDGELFDIYFACSSNRGTDPLRSKDEKGMTQARSYLADQERLGRLFEKYGKYYMNTKNTAYVDFANDSTSIYFNARISDSFVRSTLSGADAGSFRKNRRGF